jgi:Zn-dependent protease with chaperone function
MSDKVSGLLVLDAVPQESADAVISFLGNFHRSASREQLASMIARLPLTLSSNVEQQKAAVIIEKLASLGAVAGFTPAQVQGPPGPVKPASPAGKQPSLRDVLLNKAFTGERVRFPVSASYRAGMAVVACAMIMLPLVYLGIVAATGYLVYWHATANLTVFSNNGIRVALFMYVTPLIVGLLLLVFMLKPLFARDAERQKDVEIKPGEQPLLFAFVEKLCAAIGAPMPARIRLNNQVNASASFDGGMLGVFANDLVLTIGLPVAAGLDIRQFTGVLAHEFGHFAQASGMRITYVIRSINYWLSRVVYSEDEWDVRLRRWSKDIDFRLGLILYIARFFIWLTRKVLYLLMIAGNAISCYMLRQMEFDADRYEAAMVGAGLFESTSNRMTLLAVSHSWAFQDVSDAWETGRLPNNLTELVLVNYRQMKTAVRDSVMKQESASRSGWFDTHPATEARVKAAGKIAGVPAFSWPEGVPTFTAERTRQSEPVDGVADYQQTPPASIIFSKFSILCERVTLDYYKKVLGMTPERKHLVDAGTLVSSQEQEQNKFAALDQFCLGGYTPWLTVGLSHVPSLAPPLDPDANIGKLGQLRESLQQDTKKFQEALKEYKTVSERIAQAAQARVLIAAGFRIDPKAFSLPGTDMNAVATAEQRYEARLQMITGVLGQLGALYRERLVLALQLLHVPAVAAKLENGVSFRQDLDRQWKALRTMEQQLPLLEKVNLAVIRLGILVHQLSGNEGDERLNRIIQEEMHVAVTHLDDLARSQANVHYPFDHADKEMTLDMYIVGDTPKSDDLGNILSQSERAVDTMLKLIARTFAHLTHVAASVESAAGLQPLGEPLG